MKPGGLSKLGPGNLYPEKRACACLRPLPQRDAEDGSVRCIGCGHEVMHVAEAPCAA